MNVLRARWVLGFGAGAVLVACSGDSATLHFGSTDAGDLEATDAGDAGDAEDARVGTDDATIATDAGVANDAAGAHDSGEAHDAGAASDASDAADPGDAATSVWTACDVDAGVRNNLDEVGDDDCVFALAWFRENPASPSAPMYTTFLEKRDKSAGSCTEPKGCRVLTSGSYVSPSAFIARHDTEKLIVLAFDSKASTSDTARVVTYLAQIDWTGGQLLHAGQTAVTGATGTPPSGPDGSTVPTALSVDGNDVELVGTGFFQGATGSGPTFDATYLDFLEPYEQSNTLADYASRN